MINFIQDIITRFGGRYFGSEQEKKAQYYTAEVMKKYCDKVDVEEFQSPLEAHFQALKIFCVLYVIVLVQIRIDIRIAASVRHIEYYTVFGSLCNLSPLAGFFVSE
jgi:polyribonucleotide nucleotidyltransferase